MSSVFVANLNFEAEDSTDSIPTSAQVNEGNASGRDDSESMVQPEFLDSIPAPCAEFDDHGGPCYADYFEQMDMTDEERASFRWECLDAIRRDFGL